MYRNKNEWNMDIAEGKLRQRAEELFWQMSGFSEGNPASEFQKKDIYRIQKELQGQLEIKARVCPVEKYAFGEKAMYLQEYEIFYDLPLASYSDAITGVYTFIVSEKTLVTEDQGNLDQLLFHIWQNAYLDAAREWMKEWLAQETKRFVSSCIAPGFYGIDLDEIATLFKLVDGGQIGVQMREDGFLLPEKSVIGIYLTLRQDINIFGKRCKSCLARGKNCEFCMDKL